MNVTEDRQTDKATEICLGTNGFACAERAISKKNRLLPLIINSPVKIFTAAQNNTT